MAITYLHPAAESSGELRPYTLQSNVHAAGLRVGLVANSFPGATPFMQHLERSLARALPGAVFSHFQKPNVSRMADKQADEVVAQCDVAVAAWGH